MEEAWESAAVSETKKEEFSNKWRFSGAHTRLRFQLVTLSALIFFAGVFPVEQVNVPFNILQFSNKLDESLFRKTALIGIGVFWITTILDFSLLSKNESLFTKESEAGIEETVKSLMTLLQSTKENRQKIKQPGEFYADIDSKLSKLVSHSEKYKEAAQKFFPEISKLTKALEEISASASNLEKSITKNISQLGDQKISEIRRGFQNTAVSFNQKVGFFNESVQPLYREEKFINVDFIEQCRVLPTAYKRHLPEIEESIEKHREISEQIETFENSMLSDLELSIGNLLRELKRKEWTFTLDRWLNHWVPILVSVILVSFGLCGTNPVKWF